MWINNETERENALWRSSIKRMFQSNDLEGLIELRDGPECLDEEVIKLLNECIEELEEKIKGKSQADD